MAFVKTQPTARRLKDLRIRE